MTCTLQQIEVGVMRRTGPYESRTVAASPASTATLVYLNGLKSTLSLGGYVGMWLLRRGFKDTGVAVPAFVDTDRARRVKSWDKTTGYLEVDSPYALDPIADEAVEVCHLDPEHVIRPAVLAGLARCVVEDRVQVNLTGVAIERNLTAGLPWLTNASHVKDVLYKEASSTYDPVPVRWWKAEERAGAVWLAVNPDPYPQTIYLQVNRPADSWVNGGVSVDGPVEDDDVLAVDLNYAVAAGHIECWRLAKPLLQALAVAKATDDQETAADEFARQTRRRVRRARARVQLSRPMWQREI